jgi:hypothetical protein
MNELKLVALIVLCIWIAEAGKAFGAWTYEKLRRRIVGPRKARIETTPLRATVDHADA